jgi:hypothetical protein
VIAPFCDVRLPHRIASPCMVVLSSTGFSMYTATRPQIKPRRLKTVLLERGDPMWCYLAGLSSAYNCPTNRSELPVTIGTFASYSDVG